MHAEEQVVAESESKSTKKYTAPTGELSWSEDGRSVTIDGVTLRLETATASIDFIDAAIANPDLPLQGTTWEIDGFLSGGTASSFATDVRGTVRFVGDTIQLFDGCAREARQVEPGHLEVRVSHLDAGEGITISGDPGAALSSAPALPAPPATITGDEGSGLVGPTALAGLVALAAAVPTSALVRRAGREQHWHGGAADVAFGTPPAPGTDSFDGPCFHSSHWPDGLDIAGKRVAVIGTGASSMQIVPAIGRVRARLAELELRRIDDDVKWPVRQNGADATIPMFAILIEGSDGLADGTHGDPVRGDGHALLVSHRDLELARRL